jgi:hypothetical protein
MPRISSRSRQRPYAASPDRAQPSTEALAMHIEIHFKDGMSWSNYGTVWRVQYIVPLWKFDLTDPVDRKRACSPSNLRPLAAKKN